MCVDPEKLQVVYMEFIIGFSGIYTSSDSLLKMLYFAIMDITKNGLTTVGMGLESIRF